MMIERTLSKCYDVFNKDLEEALCLETRNMCLTAGTTKL